MTPPPQREHRVATLALLGLPTMGLSLAITTVAAFVPVLVREFTTSGVVAGAIVGGEGVLALILPLMMGSLSDRTSTRLGGRLPYVIAALPLCIMGLFAIPFVGSLGAIAATVFLFYVGYYVYYPPYRALFPDILPRVQLGRSQGMQTIFREVGLGAALAGAPLMLGLWRPLPFLVAAAVLATVTVVFVVRIKPHADAAYERHHADKAKERARSLVSLLRHDPQLLRLLLANSLWELAIAGMKTFVVLYIVVGTGRSHAMASLLMGIVAVVAVIAAPIAGHLADRHGAVRVARVAFMVFGAGLLIPAFTGSSAVLFAALPVIGFGGAIAMTLPYALLAGRLPRMSHGAGAGLYDFSRGVGVLLGPLATGAVIDLARPWFRETHGYGAMWIVCGLAVLISIPLVPRGMESHASPETPDRAAPAT